MVNLINIIDESLKRYFNALTKLGYISYNEVNKIIVLLFIQELLDNSKEFYLNEDDFRVFSKVISCIVGSNCLIEIPYNYSEDSITHNPQEDSLFRITENNINRTTQNNYSRIK